MSPETTPKIILLVRFLKIANEILKAKLSSLNPINCSVEAQKEVVSFGCEFWKLTTKTHNSISQAGGCELGCESKVVSFGISQPRLTSNTHKWEVVS